MIRACTANVARTGGTFGAAVKTGDFRVMHAHVRVSCIGLGHVITSTGLHKSVEVDRVLIFDEVYHIPVTSTKKERLLFFLDYLSRFAPVWSLCSRVIAWSLCSHLVASLRRKNLEVNE